VLLYLDLDGFKQISDTFGHEAGDAVLCAVAERLRSVTRACDMVVRLGGDEFVIVAPDMDPADAEPFSNSMIRRIADQPFSIGLADPVHIEVSIGFACAPDNGDVMDVLHRKADAALYNAKRSGKGVYCRFRPSPNSDTGGEFA
jgi:diguanylate cyclase (GGDEF)-like protein